MLLGGATTPLIGGEQVETFASAKQSWGRIFGHVWPFYEWAVSDLDP
jgi:hypothetical protein